LGDAIYTIAAAAVAIYTIAAAAVAIYTIAAAALARHTITYAIIISVYVWHFRILLSIINRIL
jgi:hypothetical protein